eukprot:scaffold48487_cov71-Phaeocystis_antarctica.AAC.3
MQPLRAIPVAASPPRCAVEVVAATGGVRRAPRGQPARAPLRARIGRSREAATLLHVAVPLCSETQTSEVWTASSRMRTGGRPMCSGASSFIWRLDRGGAHRAQAPRCTRPIPNPNPNPNPNHSP